MKLYLIIISCAFLFSFVYFTIDQGSYYYNKWHYGANQNPLRERLKTESIKENWKFIEFTKKSFTFFPEVGDSCNWFRLKDIDLKKREIFSEVDWYCDCCWLKQEYEVVQKFTNVETTEQKYVHYSVIESAIHNKKEMEEIEAEKLISAWKFAYRK